MKILNIKALKFLSNVFESKKFPLNNFLQISTKDDFKSEILFVSINFESGVKNSLKIELINSNKVNARIINRC